MRDCRKENANFEAIFLADLYRRQTTLRNDAPAKKANFHWNEPRDHRGPWTSEGTESGVAASIIDAQYRGHFHDIVVDDLLKGLAENGSTILKNIRVLGINGIIAIPDGASKPKGMSAPYFIEVKTGNDPGLTENQNRSILSFALGVTRRLSTHGSVS